MAKHILSVLSHTEYGNLEDSDIGLFASAFAPATETAMAILLSDAAVNYAVRGQDGTGIKIAGATVKPGFLIEADLLSVQEATIPVYAIAEDLDQRGVSASDLITGVQLLKRDELGQFVDRFDHVWNW